MVAGGHDATSRTTGWPAFSGEPDARRVQSVAMDLARLHGARQFYTLAVIQEAVHRQGLSADQACWAYAVLARRDDFDALYALHPQPLDYTAMRCQFTAMVPASPSARPWRPDDGDAPTLHDVADILNEALQNLLDF